VDHDVVVVGGGHNGLVCAAYLARAGMDVLVVEARETTGGCASTVDALGARVNICNCDHTLVRATPIAEELDLARHGLTYLDVDPASWNLSYGAGPAWPLFHDAARTVEGLRLTHPREAEGYERYVRAALPLARLLLEVALEVPTPVRAARRAASRRFAGIATLARWSRRSAGEVLRDFFDSPAVLGPAFALGPAVWGIPPSTPGSGLGALSLALKHAAALGRPVGGSGALPVALQAAFEAAGGRVRCGTRVTRIRCEGDRVRFVELDDGTLLEAGTVVVAADPQVALVDWLTDPPAAAASLVERWRTAPRDEGYESKIDAVVGELPVYRDVDPEVVRRLGVDPLHATMVVAPSLEGFEKAHHLLGRGRIAAEPMLLANLPSALDETMRLPAGQHVFSLEALYTPYSLEGGWAGSGEPLRWLDVYGRLVQPGWLESVQAWRAMTPVSYEEEFFLPRGHATSFAGGPVAALANRQPELTRYETPVQGLFLTGSATFPGAGVWGASGRNAARVILRNGH
jgi:phytoene dehydrogenase-like protein